MCNSGPERCRAVHAEQNAIAWAARTGVMLQGADLVCTHQPCLSCARSIINAGVERVTFSEEYRLKDGLNILLGVGIPVYQLNIDTGNRIVIGS
jgi:dCMP deaminase